MNTRILFIAPYLGLKELAISILDEYKNVQIDVYQGNYEKGPALLKELNAGKTYDVIITRGGTVETCKQVTTIPIVEVYINAFDILRILKLSEGYQGKKIFLAYPTIVNSFKQLSELMGYSIESQCYFAHKEAKGILESLKKEGYELVIGDNIVYEIAQELGMNSILLTSGIESVRSAIDEALRLCNALSKDKKLVVESDHFIANCKIKVDHIDTLDTADTLDAIDTIDTLDTLDTIDTIATLDNLDNLDNLDTIGQIDYTDKFVSIFNAEEISPNFVVTVFPETILSQITELSNTSLPTIITGEDGMCKSDIGFLCCCLGPQRRKSLIRVSCYSIPVDFNFVLLEGIIIKHLWKDGGTLFLEDIDQLNIDGQKSITNILKSLNKNNHIKVIASTELPVELCVHNKKLLRQLRSILDEVRIELKSFKYYRSEINNMISLYLAKLDVRCASRVVGIHEGGIDFLSDYDWPENIRQFMRVINQLALTCRGSYISQTEVISILKKEEDNHKQASLVPIDLNGSLKEIESRIINHIMVEESMNQAKVEKRLEIGHSTLWRKLK